MSTEIPYIKKDAVVTIQIGASYVERLSAMLPYFAQGRSEEEIKKMETALKDQSGIEDWMLHTQTVYMLLSTIMEEAKKTEQVIYKPLDAILQGN